MLLISLYSHFLFGGEITKVILSLKVSFVFKVTTLILFDLDVSVQLALRVIYVQLTLMTVNSIGV